MLIKSLKIHNILSIKTADLVFGNNGMVLLDGWNYDDNTANGAGKSGIFNALSFGLYGKMPRDVTPTEYLRKGTKFGSVDVEVECGSDVWGVHRERPTNVIFTKNGQPETISQEDFESKIGLTYQQFLLTIYASQLKSEKFILLNDSSKKDFLLQLMNLERFTEAREKAVKQLKDISARESKLDQTIAAMEAKIATLQESLVDPQEIRTQLTKCDTALLVEEINTLASVVEPDLTFETTVEQRIAEKRKVFEGMRQEVSALRRERELVLRQRQSKNHLPIAQCPHCTKEVAISGQKLAKAADIAAVNSMVDKSNADLESQAVDITSKINEIETALVESRRLDEKEAKIREQRTKKLQDYHKVSQRVRELEHLKGKLEQEAAYLRQQLLGIQAITDKIQQAQLELGKLNQSKTELGKERTLVEILSGMFSPVGVQAYVADMVLDQLNERVSDYMSQMWPNASYQLLSYKENKAGEVKAKFSEKIVIAGRERSLGSLSGGELRCISLAVDLAVVDVVMQMFGIELNPLILDEPFDGMDNANRERAIDVLSKLSKDREIWVIDHMNEIKGYFAKIVRVEKRNEISEIK